MEILIPTANDMVKLGKVIGELLRPGDVVALTGNLGVGKTTLVQGMARGLGIKGPVTSPTFTLIKEYSGRLPVYHIDVYRLDDPEEIELLGFDELLITDGVVIVEWADLIEALLPKNYVDVNLKRDSDIRKVTIQARGIGYDGLVEELKSIAGSSAGQCN